jgi:peptidyl-prolyl cis-trans isomerase A (cyclophilin A)
MTMRILAAALLAALSTPAFSQAATLIPAEAPAAVLVPVAIETSAGRIVVALDKTHAPISSANFLHYVDTHRYDGETFYRAMHVGVGGLIQGGVHSNVLKLFPPI